MGKWLTIVNRKRYNGAINRFVEVLYFICIFVIFFFYFFVFFRAERLRSRSIRREFALVWLGGSTALGYRTTGIKEDYKINKKNRVGKKGEVAPVKGNWDAKSPPRFLSPSFSRFLRSGRFNASRGRAGILVAGFAFVRALPKNHARRLNLFSAGMVARVPPRWFRWSLAAGQWAEIAYCCLYLRRAA